MLDPLLSKLKESNLPLPKIITIPGNHDVMWSNGNFLSKYISYINIDIDQEPARTPFLTDLENTDNFKALFNDYSSFIQRQLTGDFQEFYSIPGNDNFIVDPDYDKSRLYGYIIDKANKLIIILINTAWFSLGGQFNTLYIKEILKAEEIANKGAEKIKKQQLDLIKNLPEKEKEERRQKIEDEAAAKKHSQLAKNLVTWLKTKDILSEYNKQITGIELLQDAVLKEHFHDYPDYFVITCMHHPRNWLEWDESYSYAKGSRSERLNNILEKSDLLLTGHEHVPINVKSERILNNILHLKGGCFLEEKQHEELNFDKSWFSILEIDITRKEIIQQRFEFDSLNWKPTPFPFYPVNPGLGYPLTPARKKMVLKAFKKGTTVMLRQFLEKDLPCFYSGDFHLVRGGINEPYHIYKAIKSDMSEFCIVARKEGLFLSLFHTPEFFNDLKEQFKAHPDVQVVRFITLDLYVDGTLKNQYEDENCNRFLVFDAIVKKADNLFDLFRHLFFLSWEPESGEVLLVDSKFRRYSKLSFTNHVISYWVSERFWI